MVYGVGLPPGITLGGQSWNYLSGALDVVAHELTHGVTEFTSNLIYQNESGALNEAFSDIMATGAEFFFQPAGSGDAAGGLPAAARTSSRPGGIRSMANPQAYGDPDHYSRRFLGTADNGGVHINSGIAEPGVLPRDRRGHEPHVGPRRAGRRRRNREQIEKVFYRAFTQMLPANATFAVARAATIQAARDLVRRQQHRRARRHPGVDRGRGQLIRNPTCRQRPDGQRSCLASSIGPGAPRRPRSRARGRAVLVQRQRRRAADRQQFSRRVRACRSTPETETVTDRLSR